MELSCNLEGLNQDEMELNTNARELKPRRIAAAVANVRIRDQAEDESINGLTNERVYTEHFMIYI